MIGIELYSFLKGWYEWATNGASIESESFDRNHGLCKQPSMMVFRELVIALNFVTLPFDSDIYHYLSDSNKHLNPKRLAWVKSKIEEYEFSNKDTF